MPTKYKRKLLSKRAAWTEEDLKNAIEAIETNTMGVNAAAKHFNVPKATLLRRKKAGKLKKTGSLGPSSTLGEENEAKLVIHIKKLQKFGFAPTRKDVRYMAFALAEKLKLKHRFKAETNMAGYDWLHLFLSRHPDLSIRIAEGVSVNRCTALSRNTVKNYFELLESILTDNLLFDKPRNIFNVDETGLQLNNRPGQVIAAKGSKAVTSITSGEKGETISVIACCNGEGTFIPPYCIFKGKNVKEEFLSGMPPGSVVHMSQKSAYVNTDIFFKWLKEHFMPRKPSGKVLLILDGHTSHCNLCEMLEFADENGIIMLCLPPHTTHYLQPLDRAVFKSLKAHYYEACNNFIKTNPARKIKRIHFGTLLAQAWAKAATASNAISGFRSTGIIPFSPDAIPDYAFLSDEDNRNSLQSANQNEVTNITEENALTTHDVSHKSSAVIKRKRETSSVCAKESTMPVSKCANILNADQPGCSHWEPVFSNNNSSPVPPSISPNHLNETCDDITPGKMLELISPIPKSTESVSNVKRHSRALAQILTSPEHIAVRKTQRNNADNKKLKQAEKRAQKTDKREQKTKKNTKTKQVKEKVVLSSTSESEEDISLKDDSDTPEEWEENDCAGCGENYNATKKTDDWVQCIVCTRWLHETCLKYDNMCDRCGKKVASITP